MDRTYDWRRRRRRTLYFYFISVSALKTITLLFFHFHRCTLPTRCGCVHTKRTACHVNKTAATKTDANTERGEEEEEVVVVVVVVVVTETEEEGIFQTPFQRQTSVQIQMDSEATVPHNKT